MKILSDLSDFITIKKFTNLKKEKKKYQLKGWYVFVYCL